VDPPSIHEPFARVGRTVFFGLQETEWGDFLIPQALQHAGAAGKDWTTENTENTE